MAFAALISNKEKQIALSVKFCLRLAGLAQPLAYFKHREDLTGCGNLEDLPLDRKFDKCASR
jgi:hypothetical protein